MSEEQTLLESADNAAGQAVADQNTQAPAPTTPQVDPALLNTVGALRGITIAHNLLDNGFFNHKDTEAVRSSMKFLRNLHQELAATALAHPDADKVAELADLKGAQ